MDRVWLILQLQRATKENDWNLHLECLQRMCPMFFSYDHQNYVRYTTLYFLTMLNLPNSHPGAERFMEQNGFSVSRSDIPPARNSVDITIEQTINRHAKSHGGIIGFSRNHSAYYRWCTTRHARGTYHQAYTVLGEMDSQENDSHKDLMQSQIAKAEDDVIRVMEALHNFSNPFECDNKDSFYCLSSGAPTPKDVESDILNADKIGEEAFRTFIQERLIDKTRSFNAPIQRLKLKTFSVTAKSAKVTGQLKHTKKITAERNVFGQLFFLAVENEDDVIRVMEALHNFSNPFECDKDSLYCLSSGAPTPKDVESDILNADKIGEEACRTFIQERLIDKTRSFNDPIQRLKLKTFSVTAKSAKVAGQL